MIKLTNWIDTHQKRINAASETTLFRINFFEISYTKLTRDFRGFCVQNSRWFILFLSDTTKFLWKQEKRTTEREQCLSRYTDSKCYSLTAPDAKNNKKRHRTFFVDKSQKNSNNSTKFQTLEQANIWLSIIFNARSNWF